MTMTHPRDGRAANDLDAPSSTPATAPTTGRTLLEQIGGPKGFLYSTIPVVVFVTANAFLPLPVTIAISLAAGLGLTVARLLRRERFSSAVGSLIGVAAAVGVVAWTGSARDFFVIGIWASLAGFVAAFGSVLARRPLTGIAWNAVHGGKHPWRAHRAVLRAHDIATLAAAAVFGARFVVQQWLYVTDSTGALGGARVAMGTPLTVAAALVVFWAFRRSTKLLLERG